MRTRSRIKYRSTDGRLWCCWMTEITRALIRSDHQRLVAAAERNDVRVCPIAHWSGSDVERYATLLQTGMFAAVYLAVGLGRSLDR